MGRINCKLRFLQVNALYRELGKHHANKNQFSLTKLNRHLLKINSDPSFIKVSVKQCMHQAQFRRRTFHEPNLIQIKVGPNHENPAF